MSTPESQRLPSFGEGYGQGLWSQLHPDALITYNSALSGPGQYAYATTLWTTAAASGRIVLFGVPPAAYVAWRFFGTGSSGASGIVKIWGISEVSRGDETDYIGTFLGEFGIQLGAAQGSGGVFTTTVNLVDSVSVTSDKSFPPGAQLISAISGGWVDLVLPHFGYVGYIVEMRLGTAAPAATGLGALYRLV